MLAHRTILTITNERLMTTSFISLKSLSLSAILGGLFLIGGAQAASVQDHDHGEHGHGDEQQATKKEVAGDPYTLSTDAVSGKALGPIDKQVIVEHEGRQFRFSSEKTAATFKKSPAKYLATVDKKMIEQQLPYYPLQTCPVSGDALGGDMGEPIDVIYKNRLVRLCCGGCKRSLAKDPASIIAKLDKAVIAEQSKSYTLTTCPISGEKLGGMGDPVNIVIGNRLVRLCCNGCKKKAAKDPVAVLAKLGTASKSKGKGKSDHGGKGHGKGHGDGHGDHDHK